jgi:hypothetical protein
MKADTVLCLIMCLTAAAGRAADKTVEQAPDPRQKTLEAVHAKFERLFASTPGNGLSRVALIREHVPLRMPLFSFSFGTERWKIESLEFVGLLAAEPVVYMADAELNERIRAQLQLKAAAHDARPATQFETRAIASLPKDAVVADIKETEIRMVGALHATKNCMTCHAQREEVVSTHGRAERVLVPVKEGDVLGAFSYRISKGPDADERKVGTAGK